MHGYGIGRAIRQASSDGLKIEEGALYPALHRLERRGFLEEEWRVTETNREAKFYRLLPAGRKHLRAEVSRWREYARAVTAVLEAGSLSRP
jgi:transcriptional regulator